MIAPAPAPVARFVKAASPKRLAIGAVSAKANVDAAKRGLFQLYK